MKLNQFSTTDGRTLIRAVSETLNQGESLLLAIDDATYTRKLPVAFDASIGGHYRHCLDHFRSLLAASGSGDLNYDLRERDTVVENDRYAALTETRVLREAFGQLDADILARELTVFCKTSYSTNGTQSSRSTVAREIMYVVAHAVHHHALIGIMISFMGFPLPPGFGFAPSTLKHRSEPAAIGGR